MQKTKEESMQDYILQQSEGIFLKNGYKGTSMDMIAESCQISKPTLYRYFESKYELFMKLSQQFEHDMYHYLAEMIEKSEDQVKVMENLIDYLFQVVEQKGDFFRMMMREHHLIASQNVDQHIEWFIRSRRETISAVVNFIEEGLDPRVKKMVSMEVVAATLYNLMSGLFTDILFSDIVDPKSYKKFFVHFLQKGLLKEV